MAVTLYEGCHAMIVKRAIPYATPGTQRLG